MNKIYIHRGDCTVFADISKFLTFEIETNLDLTGWTAKFTLGTITKEITDITSKKFEIVLNYKETSKLILNSYFGSVILTDSKGNVKTITNKIPFEVTNEVIENSPQRIELSIPESTEVNLTLKVGSDVVHSINGKTGKVELTAEDVKALPNTTIIPDISNLTTKEELAEGLETKQPVGNYALKSDLENLINSLEQALAEV